MKVFAAQRKKHYQTYVDPWANTEGNSEPDKLARNAPNTSLGGPELDR